MYNRYCIDYKQTVWERIYFESEEDFNAAVENIELHNGHINGVYLEDMPDMLEFEGLLDTQEFLPVDDNDGQPTIEAYKKGILVYDNVNKHLPNE